MTHGHSKAVEIAAATKSSLTPCILDHDPEHSEMLSALVTEMGYESIPPSDPDEALKMVRHGRCRLVLADMNVPAASRYDFLDRALRSDPGVHLIVMTAEYTLESALEVIRRGAKTPALARERQRGRRQRLTDAGCAMSRSFRGGTVFPA